MIELCGLKGHRIGGALISPRHANFIENAGGATRGDAIALMAEARRRVLEQFGVVLEREVELLGGLELPAGGPVGSGRRTRPSAAKPKLAHGRTRRRAARSADVAAVAAAARRRWSRSCSSARAVGAYIGARETSIFALDRIEVTGAPPPAAARIRAALEPLRRARASSASTGATPRAGCAAVPEVADARFDRDFPHTLKVRVRLERPVAVLRRGRRRLARRPRRARVLEQLESGRTRACRGSGCRRRPTSR